MSSITEQVGRVVGRRYRLLAPVGSGASSQVFAAMDARLGRRVAVKVLHPMLTSDAAFLRRFQAEARLAASLDHPHIMRVFDWGEDDGGPFLVLEFLAGGSLRRLLDAQGRLSEEQVAHIGLQAASGLAYAHRRGIVHRDIKPGNLLFDDEGNLRLGDFGVARALAEAALTEPLGAIFGTARYASPEQAEGRPLDDRTDVYSLALVMYAALTGSVPFTRDTVSATLMARVGATLPPVRELGALGPIIAQAAISEPLARLDARAMALDLELLCRELPAPAALPLEHVVLEGGAGRLLDRDPTDVDAVRPSSAAPAAVDALERNGSNAPPAHAAPGWADRDAAGAAAAAEVAALVADPAAGIARPQPAPAPAPAAPGTFPPPGRLDDASPATDLTLAPRTETAVPVAPAPPASHKRTRRRLWPRVLLALVVLAVAAGGTAAAVIRLGVFGHDVPRLVGLPEATAAHDAHLAGLKLRVTAERYDLSVPKGDVITQSIRAGKAEKTGTVVGVVVSKGPAPVPVPSLKGDSIAAARAALLQGHLHMKLAAAVYSETVPSGVVISWTPSSGDRKSTR